MSHPIITDRPSSDICCAASRRRRGLNERLGEGDRRIAEQFFHYYNGPPLCTVYTILTFGFCCSVLFGNFFLSRPRTHRTECLIKNCGRTYAPPHPNNYIPRTFQNSIVQVTGGERTSIQSVSLHPGDVGPWGIANSGSLFIQHPEYATTATN